MFHNPQWRRCVSSRTKERQCLCLFNIGGETAWLITRRGSLCIITPVGETVSHDLRKRDCVSSTLNESLCLIILLGSLSLTIFGRGSVYHHHRRRFCISILRLKSLCLINLVRECVSSPPNERLAHHSRWRASVSIT